MLPLCPPYLRLSFQYDRCPSGALLDPVAPPPYPPPPPRYPPPPLPPRPPPYPPRPPCEANCSSAGGISCFASRMILISYQHMCVSVSTVCPQCVHSVSTVCPHSMYTHQCVKGYGVGDGVRKVAGYSVNMVKLQCEYGYSVNMATV